ncbi:hypothetical protein EBU24_02600 [bacterium]|nr:hypothetical protein [bacterium]
MVTVKFEGFFGEDNGVDSWVKSEFVKEFKTFNDALDFANWMVEETDKIVLSVTDVEANYVVQY